MPPLEEEIVLTDFETKIPLRSSDDSSGARNKGGFHEASAENSTAEPLNSEPQKKARSSLLHRTNEGSAPKDSAHIKQVFLTSD
jgi:hypothetical protein